MAKKTPQRKTPNKNGKSRKTPKRGAEGLKDRMEKIRFELASLGTTNGKVNLFKSTVEQLDALAGEIADATDRVMTAGEAIQKSADTIAAKTRNRAIKNQVKKITANTGHLFEACSVQDITGQRITKITRTLDAIEDGFHSVTRLAGGKRIKAGKKKAIERIDGGITLEGPQVGGSAVSQSDIDKLFD